MIVMTLCINLYSATSIVAEIDDIKLFERKEILHNMQVSLRDGTDFVTET